MDTMPGNDPMEPPERSPIAGLNPADLLRQGAAEDTFPDGASSGFELPPIDELAALFPRFEILELIGKGGMGAVYKVRQKDLDRIVALKILPPAIGGAPGFSDRFTREAKALAKLNHPNIVTIHEFGSASFHQPSTHDHPLFYFLMEFVNGVNLAQLMQTGRISPREALAIVPQICDALQFAHDQGVVHRDIKPENLLLDRLGRVKVADFGIAKVIALVCEDAIRTEDIPFPMDATIAGGILGTPHYMAPEQIDHPSEVDHRADIYALGVVFYQMLTGELPGKDLKASSRKVQIDVRLDEIVMRAMEKDPELRFQQVSMMRTQVEEARIPESRAKSNKRSLGLRIGLVIACATCGIFAWVKRPRSGAFTLSLFFFLTLGALVFLVYWNNAGYHSAVGSANPGRVEIPGGSAANSPIIPLESHESISLANEYLDLAEAAGDASRPYIDSNPNLVEAQRNFAEFMKLNPTLPDAACLAEARRRLGELEKTRENLSRRYLPRHPRMMELLNRIDALSAILKEPPVSDRKPEPIAPDLPIPALPAATLSINVLGDVVTPGVIRISDGTSLLDVLAGAGGWTKKGNLRKVSILYPGEGKPEVHDVQAILQGRAINPMIKNRAVVTVSEKMF